MHFIKDTELNKTQILTTIIDIGFICSLSTFSRFIFYHGHYEYELSKLLK